MKERRQHHRRVLPFVRSAVLELEGNNHIVAVADLSAEGAFLSTQLEVNTNRRLRLKVVLPGETRDVQIDCRVVRRSATSDVKSGRPAGIAVRFEGLEPAIRRRLEAFAAENPAERRPAPKERFEYKLLDCDEVEVGELSFLEPEQIGYWAEMCFKGTIAEGAELDIRLIRPLVACEECGFAGEIPLAEHPAYHFRLPVFECRECGSPRIEVKRGRGCTLRRIEMETPGEA